MELCQGFLTYRNEEDGEGHVYRIFETLFAVLNSGEIFASEEIELTDRPNPNFDLPGRAWSRVAELPERREYIGNYPLPKKLDRHLDPRIGELCTDLEGKAKTVFYCFVRGVYLESANPTLLEKLLATCDDFESKPGAMLFRRGVEAIAEQIGIKIGEVKA